MKGDILLSPKHGINPAIPVCFFCLEDKNEVILPGKMKDDMEAPRGMVWNMEPCERCADLMKEGIMLASVRDGESGDNPYRTGGMVVIDEDAMEELLTEELFAHLSATRFGFIEDHVWKALELP
jgi:hypothetical protein